MFLDAIMLDVQVVVEIAFDDPPERLQEFAIERFLPPRRQVREQRRGGRMVDLAEQGLGRREIGGRSVRQRITERRRVAELDARRKMLRQDRRDHRVLQSNTPARAARATRAAGARRVS